MRAGRDEVQETVMFWSARWRHDSRTVTETARRRASRCAWAPVLCRYLTKCFRCCA